jgi:hypothetical protein
MALAVRRNQLHRLYRRAIVVRRCRHPNRVVLEVEPFGAEARRVLREAPVRSVHLPSRHRPASCPSCEAPLTARGICTICPAEGLAV